MFKIKNKETLEISQALDSYCDDYGKTWFLIWAGNKWAWRSADDYVPPNYVPKKKVIVCGSRNFQNYPLLRKEMNEIKEKVGEVVCGEAKGADTLGRVWAQENGIKIKSFPANWQMYGSQAGYIRNCDMGDYADIAIAFWDGESSGTRDMIKYMEKLGKEVKVIQYNKTED